MNEIRDMVMFGVIVVIAWMIYSYHVKALPYREKWLELTIKLQRGEK